ncbi:MAG: hypothetical protein JWN48_5095 [Myxococcaceae bacterium]|nr:hypothetical protein [Myxococcaceae bacterium]
MQRIPGPSGIGGPLQSASGSLSMFSDEMQSLMAARHF